MTERLVYGSQTLVPGGPALTVSGTVFSLPPSGTDLVVNGVTQPVPIVPAATEALVLGSETLTPGGAITVSGTVLSLAPGGAAVVVGGQTELLTSTGMVNVGDVIFSVFGAGGYFAAKPTTTNPTSEQTAAQGTGVQIAVATADAGRLGIGRLVAIVLVGVCLYCMRC